MGTHGPLISIILAAIVVSGLCQKTIYNMDDRADCGLGNAISIEKDQTIYVNAKQFATSGLTYCRIDFQAEDTFRLIRVEVSKMNFMGQPPCPVNLFLHYGSNVQPNLVLNCGAAWPSPVMTDNRGISVRFSKTALDYTNYDYQLTLTTYSDDSAVVGSNTDHTPLGAGVIVGIVAGIVVFLVLVIIILCCCCRKANGPKHRPYDDAKMKFRDEPSTHTIVNENGRPYSDYNMKPKVTSFDGPGIPKTRNVSDYEEQGKSPKQETAKKQQFQYNKNNLDNLQGSPTRKQKFPDNWNQRENVPGAQSRQQQFQYDQKNISDEWQKTKDTNDNDDAPQSPLLAAIRNSARHKTKFKDTEAEAEERMKRFSSHSSIQSDKPPTPPPSLPVLPRENILRGPQRPPGPKQASIRRAPRPASSHEEMEQLGQAHHTEQGDSNIRIIPDSPLDKSHPEGIIPIQTADPHSPLPQRKSFFSDSQEEEYYSESEIPQPKYNTQHSLRPNRKRGPETEKRKPTENGTPKQNKKLQQKIQTGKPPVQDKAPQQKPPIENLDKKKKSQKSPRLGSMRRPKQPAASRGDEEDPAPSRPDTPTSIVAKGFRVDDMEFSPLQRTGSRQSLYASRSSLYGRRGRKDRSSFSESVASYAHDDIDVYRHREEDYDNRPMNKRDRYFKSLGDIHYGGPPKEQSTQTLRETATQTGSGMIAQTKSRRASQRKSPKSQRAMSSSGTQTKQDAKPFEQKVITPRYQKAPAKNTKISKGVATGVGPEASEEEIKNKPKTNATKKKTLRPKTPEPVQSSEESIRPKTPESYAQSRPTYSSSPVPSVPVHANLDQEISPVTDNSRYPSTGYSQDPYTQPHFPDAVYHQQPTATYPQSMTGYGDQVPMVMYAPSPVPAYSPAPPQHSPSPVPYGAPTSSHPAKSPWELLCDLTDKEYQSRPPSQGPQSQAGSSYSGAHPKQPFHPGFRQPDRLDQSQHPDRTGPLVRSQTPGAYPTSIPQTDNRPGSAQSDPSNNLPAVPQPTMYPKKSSWEQLKQLTDSEYKLTYGASSYAQSESNV